MAPNNLIIANSNGGRLRKKPPKRQPVWLYPFTTEREYQSALVKHMNDLQKVTYSIVLPHLNSLVDSRNISIPEAARSDEWSDELDRLITSLTIAFGAEAQSFPKKQVAAKIGNDVDVWNSKEWQKQLRAAFGVNIFTSEPFVGATLENFVNENVSYISKLERDVLADVSNTIRRGIASGSSSANIAKDIQKRFNTSKSYSKVLARDQVGKVNGQLAELRQTNLGVGSYIWRTSRDERVRFSHRLHDGKTFKWNNPPADTGHPGQDYNCRCYPEPVFDDVFEELGIVL